LASDAYKDDYKSVSSAANQNADFSAFDVGVDPILRMILPVEKARNVVEYQVDPALQQRIEELARKSNEGELTEAELIDYQGFVRANNFAAILQATPRAHRVHSPQIPGHPNRTVDFIQYRSPLQADGPIHLRFSNGAETKLPFIPAG
jgi:hypothetical protein